MLPHPRVYPYTLDADSLSRSITHMAPTATLLPLFLRLRRGEPINVVVLGQDHTDTVHCPHRVHEHRPSVHSWVHC